VDSARRSFLRGRFLTREGRDEARGLVRTLGPRPPALPAALQWENPCEYCHHPCLAACDPGVIRLHPEDHVLRGLPYLSFEQGGCTFCRACVEVCPLKPEEDADATAGAIGLARLQQDACMAWNGVICMSCEFACTHRAIRMRSQRQPVIDDERCTGCGFCVSVCPSDAISVQALGPSARRRP